MNIYDSINKNLTATDVLDILRPLVTGSGSTSESITAELIASEYIQSMIRDKRELCFEKHEAIFDEPASSRLNQSQVQIVQLLRSFYYS